jgi:hypothetical protein
MHLALHGMQELEDYPTMGQHLQRLQERLGQVSAARDGAAHYPGAAAAAEHGGTILPPASVTNALWTERFQPQHPSQACHVSCLHGQWMFADRVVNCCNSTLDGHANVTQLDAGVW